MNAEGWMVLHNGPAATRTAKMSAKMSAKAAAYRLRKE